MGLFSSFSPVTIRSMISKVGPEEDLGKIFSLVSSLEATSPIISSPLLSFVYNSSIETFPGAVYLVQCGFFLIVGIVIAYVFYVQVRNNPVQYGTLSTVADQDEEGNENESTDEGTNDDSPSSQI